MVLLHTTRLRVGVSILAAARPPIWQTASLSHLHPRHFGYASVDALHQDQRPVDRKQDPSGIFGAPIESLCEISTTDIYFTHERGQYMAMYALFLAGSNFSAPIIAGFITDGQGLKVGIVLVHDILRHRLRLPIFLHGGDELSEIYNYRYRIATPEWPWLPRGKPRGEICNFR
jgi:MFS family permease